MENITLLHRGGAGYPARLQNLKNPPETLYVRGGTDPLDGGLCVAVVGTRAATAYGLSVTASFCRDFCEAGFTIVTGGARGIDTAAARTALKYGGKLILVLGCGVDVAYPPENAELFEETVKKGGTIISELPPGTQPISNNFPSRNRIIAALADGCLVTEAGEKSGALITAERCFDQRKPVFSVPGNITSGQSAGTNELIRSGAEMALDGLRVAAEIKLSMSFAEAVSAAPKAIAEKRPVEKPSPRPEKKVAGLTPDEEKIMAAIRGGAATVAEISSAAGLDEVVLAPAMVMLEIKGVIRREFGGRYEAI